jgi:hypothetical protein
MRRSWRFWPAGAAFLAAVAGCTVPTDYLIRHTAANTDCSSGQVEIVGSPPTSSVGVFSWMARCRNRQFECRQRMIGDRAVRSCEETPASFARTAVRIAGDRLALETGCERSRIRLVEEADWSRGGERAFRFDACGQPYICTTAPGRTDCEAAASQRSQAPVAPSSGALARAEVLGILSSAEAEARACVTNAGSPPQSLNIRMQVNGDGSALYMGTTPAAPAEAASCLRQLVSTLRFRATGGAPIAVTSPPLEFSQASALEPEPEPAPELAESPQTDAPPSSPR